MDFVFNMNEDVKPEVKSEIRLQGIKDAICDDSLQNKIKEETCETEFDICANKDSICKIQIKSKADGLEWDASCDDNSIKLELLHEELDIKTEIVYHEDQTFDMHEPEPSHLGEKIFKCSICSFASVHKCNLQRHLKTHNGEKPFKCNECDYGTVQKDSLKQHMKTHTGEKPFKCCLCSYASVRKDSYQLHMKTHTGEKPFQCSSCSYASADKRNLGRHMKIHTGVKPFKCGLCSYASIQRDKLERHMKTHTGEKPFKCVSCSYASIQRGKLEGHMKTHTRQSVQNIVVLKKSVEAPWKFIEVP